MTNSRLIWADSLKGFLIILVVLGHAIQITLGNACETNHLWNIIYSFHMPAFMAVSGYVAFRPEACFSNQSVLRTIWRRFGQLMIPFMLWTFIAQLVGGQLDLRRFGDYLLYPDKGLWFLWVLFFINAIFMFGSWFAQKLRIVQEMVVAGICLALVSVMVLFDVRVFGFQFVAYYFLFYSFGYFFRKYEDFMSSSSIVLLAIMGVCWTVLAWFWHMHELPDFMKGFSLPATLTQYVYRFVAAAIAIYLLLDISPRLIDDSSPWNQPFVRLGSMSLGIYATHYILLGWLYDVFKELTINDEEKVACLFLMTLVAASLVVWLLIRWSITAKYLLGKI